MDHVRDHPRAPAAPAKGRWACAVLVVGRMIPRQCQAVYDALAAQFAITRVPGTRLTGRDEPYLGPCTMQRIMVQFHAADDPWSQPAVLAAREPGMVLIRIGATTGGDINLPAPPPQVVVEIIATLATLMDAGQAGGGAEPACFVVNGWTVDSKLRVATQGEHRISLGPVSVRLLAALVAAGDHGISREDLIRSVWGGAPRGTKDRLAVNVHRLRQTGILPKDALVSVRGGYLLKS